MEDTQIIDILYIAFLEAEAERMFLGEEVNRIQRLCLRLGDRRDAL